MKLLLPHKFKRIGAIMAPLGLVLWICMQTKLIHRFAFLIATNSADHFISQQMTVVFLSITFFSFLLGIYFMAFSREKVEDEMIVQKRVESFQFAALIQLVVIILGFILMLLIEEPGKERLMLFLQ